MEQLKRLQSIEREMLSEGKSSSEIDAFKAKLRQQSYTGTTPKMGGVAAYMQEGGDPAEKSFFERFNPLTGSYRRKKPLSVKVAETAIDFSPVSTVEAIKEIYDESQKEDPDLTKMGIMAAAEVAGYVPLAGPGIKKMARGRLSIAEEMAAQKQRSINGQIADYKVDLEENTLLSKEEIESRVNRFIYNINKENGMADGGAVMQGVGSLNETARNMSRGPRGIAGYQQFAPGGPVNKEPGDDNTMSKEEFERLKALYQGPMFEEIDLPVGGRIDFKRTNTGRELFDVNLNKTFKNDFGRIRPSLDYSTQTRSRTVGEAVVNDKNKQIGFTVNGVLFLNPNNENELRGAINVENNRSNRSVELPEGELVQTSNGEVLKRFNLGATLGNFTFDVMRREGTNQDPRTSGSATYKIGDNGIFRYSNSSNGDPSFGLEYNKEIGKGIASLEYEYDGEPSFDFNYTTPLSEGEASFVVEDDQGDMSYETAFETPLDVGNANFSFERGNRGNTFGANYKLDFADGGPVYMKKGGEGKEESARQKILNTIYGVESNNNYDAWNNSAKNPPQKDLTSLTVKEIMDYQGNNKGPAAGAGQIKFDTLSYLINAGTLSEDDLFTAATQDIANNKLLDRRGFNSWLSGDLSDLDFGDNIASEWASIPLLSSMTTPNGVEKERGESRYGGSNKALLGADVWENVLYTAKGQSKTPQTIDEIVLAEAYTPEKLVSEVMAGSPTYMTDESSPLSMVERYPQSGPLGRVESYPVDRVERYPVDRVERYPDMQQFFEKSGIEQFFPEKQMDLEQQVGTPQESLYEKYSPQVVQDALLGIGYLNSVSGPSATNQ